MSQQVALQARPRVGSGKGEARALRREGRVPAIAYGTDLEPTALSVDALALYRAMRTDAGTNAILRLDIAGDSHLALAREIHRHPVKRHVLHVDFVTVNRNVKVTVDVPVRVEGDAPGVDEGGVTELILFALPVQVLPLEVPAEIVVDISSMQIGDVLRVADLDLPAGVEALEDPERTVVTIIVPHLDVAAGEPAGVAAAEAEGATEAEVQAAAEAGRQE